MTKSKKVFTAALIAVSLFSCKKSEKLEVEQPAPFNNRETINKMVEITKLQTVKLKQKIEALTAQNLRMTNAQYENFVRQNIEEYSQALIEAEPNYVENNNFQINQIDTEDWTGEPNIYSGDAESALPNTLLTRFDAVADQLEAIDNNPIYDNESNLNNGAIEMENILQAQINSINNDASLSTIDKQGLSDAFQAAKELIQPEIGYFRTLAEGAQALNQDITTWRGKTFWGKLLRAVARVAIAVVAVALVTAMVVYGAPLLAASSKFALKIAAKGATKSILFGVGKKVTYTNALGMAITHAGGLVMPGALYFGGVTGVVKASTKWDTDMSLKYWYKELEFKFKAKP
jgi:hypothetical protein